MSCPDAERAYVSVRSLTCARSSDAWPFRCHSAQKSCQAGKRKHLLLPSLGANSGEHGPRELRKHRSSGLQPQEESENEDLGQSADKSRKKTKMMQGRMST